MQRLDYRINEGGMERWVTRDIVINRLLFLYPALAEEIDQKMRFNNEPFEYAWGPQNVPVRIEYKGPRPGAAAKREDNI